MLLFSTLLPNQTIRAFRSYKICREQSLEMPPKSCTNIGPEIRKTRKGLMTWQKEEASISVSGYTSASCPQQGAARIGNLVYPNTPMLASHFCHLINHFSTSSFFQPNFHAPFWWLFQALFSLNSICTENFGCLVSNGHDLA